MSNVMIVQLDRYERRAANSDQIEFVRVTVPDSVKVARERAIRAVILQKHIGKICNSYSAEPITLDYYITNGLTIIGDEDATDDDFTQVLNWVMDAATHEPTHSS